MSLADLSPAERQIVQQCLHAAAAGPFFPDWEFHTLFGLNREDVRRAADAWPIDDSSRDVRLAIHNAMNSLIGYPHGREDAWDDYVSAPVHEVIRVFEKWRGAAR